MLSDEQFGALKYLEDQEILLVFNDGKHERVRLISVTQDFDGSRHVVYEVLPASQAFYANGESIMSFEK